MKHKLYHLGVGLLSLFCACDLSADEVNRPDNELYKRGIMAIEADSLKLAKTYFTQEIEEHPDNGYAYAHLAVIRLKETEYAQALAALNGAIERIPSEDKEYRAYIHATRAHVYLQIADTTQAYNDLDQAIRYAPEQILLYQTRAQLYYEQGNYTQSDADYQRIIELDERDEISYIGLGRNAKARGMYEEALRLFDYVNELYPNYDEPYAFRSDCFIEMKQYDRALDDVIHALGIGHGDRAFSNLLLLADSAFTLTVDKLKAQKMKEPEVPYYAYDLGVIFERVERYREAIPFFEESFALDYDSADAYRLAYCYERVGFYVRALHFCDQAISLDDKDNRHLYLKAWLLDHMGRTKEAISVINECISNEPNRASLYYARGWFEEHTGKPMEAIEDFTTCLLLSPEYAYAYLNRGIIYLRAGEKSRAARDFRKVVELETDPREAECAYYAYYSLGDKETAVEWLNQSLQQGNQGAFYDAVCLYAQMGETGKAIDYLRESLKRGFRRFAHIRRDRMLDSIRHLPEFEELLKTYEAIHAKEVL